MSTTHGTATGQRWNDRQPQDRLPPIPPEEMTAAQREAAEQFEQVRSTPPFGPFVPLLRSPDVMVLVGTLGEHLRYRSVLPPHLSEFVILLIARHWTQQYEWYVHEPIAAAAGIDRSIIDRIAEGRTPDVMSEEQDALFALCRELNHDRMVSDETYARALRLLGEQGVMDAAATVGYYTLLAMVMNTGKTALPEGVRPPLRPLAHR